MSSEVPVYSRKKRKANGEFEEVAIGRPAVTIIAIVVIAILTIVFAVLDLDSTSLLKAISQLVTSSAIR